MEFITSTIGLKAEKSNRASLVRVEFYRNADKSITLQPVSGHNLSRKDGTCTVSAAEFSDRPHDQYNNVVEARWAFSKCGYSICGDDSEEN